MLRSLVQNCHFSLFCPLRCVAYDASLDDIVTATSTTNCWISCVLWLVIPICLIYCTTSDSPTSIIRNFSKDGCACLLSPQLSWPFKKDAQLLAPFCSCDSWVTNDFILSPFSFLFLVGGSPAVPGSLNDGHGTRPP